MLYTSKGREKNIFSDHITFITISKSSDLRYKENQRILKDNNPQLIHFARVSFDVSDSDVSDFNSCNKFFHTKVFCKAINIINYVKHFLSCIVNIMNKPIGIMLT